MNQMNGKLCFGSLFSASTTSGVNENGRRKKEICTLSNWRAVDNKKLSQFNVCYQFTSVYIIIMESIDGDFAMESHSHKPFYNHLETNK